MAQPETDPFDDLRARIRSTADAAERLSFEAAMGGEDWAGRSESRARTTDDATQEAQALVNLSALLRDVRPDELRRQLADLVRQVLLLLRAVLDHVLHRLEAPAAERPSGPVVEDIPLD